MLYSIKYGAKGKIVDITCFCLNFLRSGNYILIPKNDVYRAALFSDPFFGVIKHIIINDTITSYVFDSDTSVIIDIHDNKIYSSNTNIPENIQKIFDNFEFPIEKLIKHQNELIIKHCEFNLNQEFPEQLFTTLFLTGNEKVLELGSNIGRNSLIIGNILRKNNNNNFVTLECDPISFEKLKENRDINNLNFHIENCALSKRKLIQKGWDTIISDVVQDGWTPVNIITYNELKKKYNIEFDTLIADCEGALLPILLDMPELLENMNLIILENDYKTSQDKSIVDYILKFNGFKCVLTRPIDNQDMWLEPTCGNNFYEVWKR